MSGGVVKPYWNMSGDKPLEAEPGRVVFAPFEKCGGAVPPLLIMYGLLGSTKTHSKNTVLSVAADTVLQQTT
jgi:hypothetical protein